MRLKHTLFGLLLLAGSVCWAGGGPFGYLPRGFVEDNWMIWNTPEKNAEILVGKIANDEALMQKIKEYYQNNDRLWELVDEVISNCVLNRAKSGTLLSHSEAHERQVVALHKLREFLSGCPDGSVNINCRRDGLTVLMKVAKMASAGIDGLDLRPSAFVLLVHLLVEFNADVNAQNFNGNTAAHYVSQNGGLEVLEALMKNGADPFILNSHRQDAYSLARSWGFWFQLIIEQAMAKRTEGDVSKLWAERAAFTEALAQSGFLRGFSLINYDLSRVL